MKKLPQLIPVLFFLLSCQPSFAQKKSVSGYYVTLKGDTVKGMFPSYRSWNKNPSKVEFVADGTTTTLELVPQDISKFVVTGFDEYVSYSGQRLINPIEDAVLFNNGSFTDRTDQFEEVKTFLRLVTRTTAVDLYILNDGKRINLFYQLPGGPVSELKYKKALDNNQVAEFTEYRQQLDNSFGAVITQKDLNSTLAKLPYTEEALLAFVHAMFPPEKIERSVGNTTSAWVIDAGVSVNSVSVKTDKSYDAVPSNYDASVSPLLSVGFLMPSKRNFGKYFFYPQLALFRYKNTGKSAQGSFINSVTYQANLVMNLKVGGGINIVNRDNLQWFIGTGAGILLQAGARKVGQLYSPDGTPYGSATETTVRPLTYSIDLSTGVVIKRIIIGAAYMLPVPITSYAYYTTRLSTVRLSVGYKL